VWLVGALAGLCGCSVGAGTSYDSPAASPDTSWDQKYCDLRGGSWNRTANVCESPLFGWW
jgi:hypothetical protein